MSVLVWLLNVHFITVMMSLLTTDVNDLLQILTTKLVLLFNVFGFGLVFVIAMFLTHGKERVKVLGWICMVFALCVFVAPLGIVVRK